MVSQCTKFEVSRFTRYEAMNGSAKCRNWCDLGWLGALKVIGNVTIRQSAYDFLFDFNRNYVSILYRFRDIAGYWSKVADFDPPHLHSAPSQAVTPVEFRGDLWLQKTRFTGLSCGVACMILRLAVLVEHRLMMDGQTDGQTERRTQGHGQYRGCIASRGKNHINTSVLHAINNTTTARKLVANLLFVCKSTVATRTSVT